MIVFSQYNILRVTWMHIRWNYRKKTLQCKNCISKESFSRRESDIKFL